MKWLDKNYHSLDYEMKTRFGEKVYRIALSGGCTCPNRDGTIGQGGCIFCSAGGSGDFAGDPSESITQQIIFQEESLKAKISVKSFIAYFQAYTNTYAPLQKLRRMFTEAILRPEIRVLSIATRPDCLPPDVVQLLAELNRIKPVWVELGLQTMHEDTARLIRRGYPLSVFEKAVRDLRSAGIEVIVHVILSLPGEDGARVLQTIGYLDGMDIQGVKLQMLHVLKGTDLAAWYERQEEGPGPELSQLPAIRLLTQQEYVSLVIDCLEHLRPDIVIHRLTGDGPSQLLIAPAWSENKRGTLNLLNHEMAAMGRYQGSLYLPKIGLTEQMF